MDVKVNLKMKFTFDKLLKNIYKKPINQFNPMTNKKKQNTIKSRPKTVSSSLAIQKVLKKKLI